MHLHHACVEQVSADLDDSALAHLPSGKFTANAGWLTTPAAAYNLTRAAGRLASVFHAKARTGTIRRHLINVPARITSGSRRIVSSGLSRSLARTWMPLCSARPG